MKVKVTHILLAVFAAIFVYNEVIKKKIIKDSWAETTATITDYSVEPTANGVQQKIGFYSTITSSYTVDGKQYTNEWVNFTKKGRIPREMERYKPGVTLRLKYEPRSPWNSVVITPFISG
ncbi:DUF3592 domain-containing protein [Pseudomonas solani]|uniref:DUF3592 domain-containing protein n=1 Tax=Pseudomonas solani TaxID=2731552 RepID=UPI003C2DEBB4